MTRADQTLVQHPAAVSASSSDAFAVYSTRIDASGASHVRYTRTYHGLRVAGGDIVVHLTADGGFAGSSVGLAAPLTVGVTPTVAAAKARLAAQAHFTGTLTSTGAAELFVDASSGIGRLAWETVVSGVRPDGQTPSRLHVIIDAITGTFIGSFDEIETVNGTGKGIYSGTVTVDTTVSGSVYTMTDPSHGNGYTCDMNNGTNTTTCTLFTDAANTWGNGTQNNRASAAVDAHYGAALTFDYYKTVHGRNGIFGDGTGVPSRVHFLTDYTNALWDGSQMNYGDGAGDRDPWVSIDIVGHEMSHGVTANVVPGNLTYSGETGGLNESTSDIFGNMVEFFANNPNDPGDYLVGEMIDAHGDGTPLRYMYNPALDGRSDSCWSTGTVFKDVHYSSGVGNHFFFDLAEGTGATAYGTSPICAAAPAVTGIGRAKAEKIWFRALDVYFTSSTMYVSATNPANTARAYTLSAAADLYGRCSVEYKTVQAAWTAVNVAGSDTSCSADDFSLSVSPTSGATNPGSSVTATVSTAVTNGSAAKVTFSASGLPAGASASFNPSSVTAGGSSTMTISTSTTTTPGTYPVSVVGTSPSNSHSTPYTLTVNGPSACSGTNAADVQIPDLSTVESLITINGCAGSASATSTVEVHIVHPHIGDLTVNLVAPDGSLYLLHNGSGGNTNNINQTYTVNLSSEVANGTWKLRVQDTRQANTGYIDSWTLTL